MLERDNQLNDDHIAYEWDAQVQDDRDQPPGVLFTLLLLIMQAYSLS